jgi:hypothetical protein
VRDYNDFIKKERVIGKRLLDNPVFHGLFDLLMEDENRITMVTASAAGKPAIQACVSQIEEYIAAHPEGSVDLKNDHTKQSLGRMVKYILEPFGYRPARKRVFSKRIESNYLTSGMTYDLTGVPELIIVQRIVPANENRTE